jgi:hypothetical protein
MDAGLTTKPVVGAAVTDHARPAAASVQTGVPTDLPEAKAIVPAADASATGNNAPRLNNSSADYTTHDVTIDAQTREVIYRVIDTRTRQVIRQVPDEALLRSRAYSKAIENGSSPFAAQAQADLEA